MPETPPHNDNTSLEEILAIMGENRERRITWNFNKELSSGETPKVVEYDRSWKTKAGQYATPMARDQAWTTSNRGIYTEVPLSIPRTQSRVRISRHQGNPL